MEAEDLAALVIDARLNSVSREAVVLECMGLIAHVARRCRNTLGEDAFGEASVALLEAIDSYEQEQGDFRTWAVYLMTCHLSNAAQKEKRYRARLLRMDEAPAPSDQEPMPELLSRAVAAGKLSERQAQIVHAKAWGEAPCSIMERFSISERTYHYELAAAMAALRSYL